MTSSLSQGFEQHALRSAAIELAVVDALPRPEVELAVCDRHEHLMAKQHPLEVRIGIVFAGLVMAIVESVRRELFEPLHDIVPQTRFVVVDEYARRDMHRAHEDETVAQPCARADFLDP